MNDKEFVEKVRDRPEMFGLDRTYHPTAMLLLGYDLASSGGVLRGFTEWLVVRKGECSSLVWFALVLEDAVPGVVLRNPRQIEPEHQEQAVEHLFRLVLAFLDMRDDKRELAAMYARYDRMNSSFYGTS
ncbi:hypothetical protein H9Y04_34500 [Streptomyces sp. TRM66268-LWL]|uniref:Uncharacterized protein n=1 Tax=Streptomyces polyasparticus TaxID=2767826 RepID=A0ABR7SSK4_9ACTN|nr:hypothetical protein [Streptomyces polyasparticus]MBC9717655.1 hypothetical protein [Streptomyces polyasparticus]